MDYSALVLPLSGKCEDPWACSLSVLKTISCVQYPYTRVITLEQQECLSQKTVKTGRGPGYHKNKWIICWSYDVSLSDSDHEDNLRQWKSVCSYDHTFKWEIQLFSCSSTYQIVLLIHFLHYQICRISDSVYVWGR